MHPGFTWVNEDLHIKRNAENPPLKYFVIYQRNSEE